MADLLNFAHPYTETFSRWSRAEGLVVDETSAKVFYGSAREFQAFLVENANQRGDGWHVEPSLA